MGREPNPELADEAAELMLRLRSTTPPVKLTEEERDELLARPGLSRASIETLLSLETDDVRRDDEPTPHRGGTSSVP